jgi:enediyne polyketide synthase
VDVTGVTPAIAIVGAGCRYPDAPDPDRLWELVLAGRRAFRPIPRGRLNLADYGANEGPDSTYVKFAAVLNGWQFDRERYRIPGNVHRVTDLTHWLAVDVAADTLEAAGFPDGSKLDRDRAGVILGNTLTGEFARASLLRLRWPYVRRVLARALSAHGPDLGGQARLLDEIERSYKEPFPEPNEESLAGGLANTIAGRICNYFDLHGGGYTVDGACASSLLAVITACRALAVGELDFALAGGVDLSLDPFELVGFARTGALATSEMRVYDAEPTGFWPGEGCGIVALMRAEDAAAAGRTPLALIRGWGMSSDGHGGLTRPTVAGQLLAQSRACQMADFTPDTVALFEGHGTGTAVGDHAELEAVIAARDRRCAAPGALGSIKANIGHTKAAAGVAGLLKATLALQHQVIPPTTGCRSPHELLAAPGAPLRIVPEAEAWPEAPLRAAVNALGFGGINTNVVLEGAARRRPRVSARELRMGRRPLDVELFAFGAESTADLRAQLAQAADAAETMSFAEHIDMAASLAARAASATAPQRLRMALTARDPAQLAERAQRAQRMLMSLENAADGALLTAPGIFAGCGAAGRLGLLFTGQAAPVRSGMGALRLVLPGIEELLPPGRPDVTSRADEPVDTSIAQPAIFRASVAGLAWLAALGVDAQAAIGHSLGEITALHWAGVITEADAAELVGFRGRVMSHNGTRGTGMASITASPERTAALIAGTGVVLAADNGPAQVVAGGLADLDRIIAHARADGIPAQRLRVSHAFHSPAMAAARPILARRLAAVAVGMPERDRTVYSTVTGQELTLADDIRGLLAEQVTAPVLFRQALGKLAADCALLIEVGPGHGLATLASEITGIPTAALDVGAQSADGLCMATAALYAAGQAADVRPLFASRFHRDFDLWREPQFLLNPCESGAPEATIRATRADDGLPAAQPGEPATPGTEPAVGPAGRDGDGERSAARPPAVLPGGDTPAPGTLETVATAARRLIAEAAELPAEAISDRDRMLSDLHLSSLRVTQIAAAIAVQCAREIPASPLPLADASVADLITAIEALPQDSAGAAQATADATSEGALAGSSTQAGAAGPAGVTEWHRVFGRELAAAAIPGEPQQAYRWQVHGTSPLRTAIEPLLPSTDDGPTAVLVFLPEDPADPDIATLIAAARSAAGSASLLAVVDHGDTASGFLASVGQEHPGLATRRVEAGPSGGASPRQVSAAIAGALGLRQAGHAEFAVDAAGQVSKIRYKPMDGLIAGSDRPVALNDTDVILVTGGGKGIGFSSAAVLASHTGARLALLGRSRPEDDSELSANLDTLRGAGADFRYAAADVTDPAAVQAAITAFTRNLGPVTAVIHSSGLNEPARFSGIDDAAFAAHAAPKYHGLRTVLGALDTAALRLVVTYGSVIGRFGLAGEAHYALANGRMRELTRVLGAELPHCWVCNVDWTAWRGAGMGERLGVLDTLRSTGVVPIPATTANGILLDLLAARPAARSVIVSGRLPQLDRTATRVPGPHTYLRQVVAHVPGVELVAEADLSLAVDTYLRDHRIDGLCVLPAVCAMEAMAEAARALTGKRPAGITGGCFERPVIVADDGTTAIRICALVRPDGDVDVVLRSSETGFAADHFTARVTARPAPPPSVPREQELVPAHDGRALYGPLFFHGEAFQRLRRYEELSATSCTAVLAPARPATWRGAAERQPSEPLLGDPMTNDASIHVLQGCVPHRRLLPVGCDRFSVHDAHNTGDGELVACAVERAHDGADYTYDVVVADSSGRPVCSWAGLRLRDVGPAPEVRWPMILLGSYLQRRASEIMSSRTTCVEVRVHSRVAAALAHGTVRQDHSIAGGTALASSSELDGMVLSAPCSPGLACAWAPVTVGDAPGGTGDASLAVQVGQLRRFSGEPAEYARARLLMAQACLDQVGRPAPAALRVRAVYERGWISLRAGDDDVTTAVLEIEGQPRPVVVAIAVRGD